MLIGISGKMGSGKNLVCTIIQGLTAAKKHDIENPSFEWIKKYYINSIWEQKAFADKLKDFVCMLIGCTREQLEDQTFKATELGEEWWVVKKWYPAHPNKDKVFTLYPYQGFDSRIFDGDDSCMWEVIKTTPRFLLQLIGTEGGRDLIHPNVWVNSLMSEYKAKWVSTGDSVAEEDVSLQKEFPSWIITDMRFPNELKAVKDRDGITIRVNRPYTTVVGGNGIPAAFSQNQFHPSETSLDSATFDFVISNDKDIEHLINEVRKILEKLSII